jgi:hypothetical protein
MTSSNWSSRCLTPVALLLIAGLAVPAHAQPRRAPDPKEGPRPAQLVRELEVVDEIRLEPDLPGALRLPERKAFAKRRGRDFSPDEGMIFVAFAPGGRTLFSGYNRGVLVWQVDGKKPKEEAPLPHIFKASCMALSRDGKTLVTATSDKAVKVWDIKGAEQLEERDEITFAEETMDALALSPDGKTMALGNYKDRLVTLQPLGGANAKPRSFKVDRVRNKFQQVVPLAGLAFAPDGRRLATLSQDSWGGQVELWDLSTTPPKWVTGAAITEKFGFKTRAALAFSPDGQTLAVSTDKDIRLFEVKPRHLQDRGILLRHEDPVTGLAFTPDSKTLASAGADGRLILWDKARRQPRLIHEGAGSFQGVALAPGKSAIPLREELLVAGANANGSVLFLRLQSRVEEPVAKSDEVKPEPPKEAAAKPKQPSKEETAAKAEQMAAAKLKLARMLVEDAKNARGAGRLDEAARWLKKAKAYCQEILEQFPNTVAAPDAKALMESIRKEK